MNKIALHNLNTVFGRDSNVATAARLADQCVPNLKADTGKVEATQNNGFFEPGEAKIRRDLLFPQHLAPAIELLQALNFSAPWPAPGQTKTVKFESAEHSSRDLRFNRQFEAVAQFAGTPLEVPVAMMAATQADPSLLSITTVERFEKSGIFQSQFPNAVRDLKGGFFQEIRERREPPAQVPKWAAGDATSSVTVTLHNAPGARAGHRVSYTVQTTPNAVVAYAGVNERHHPRMGHLRREDPVVIMKADDQGRLEIPQDTMKTGLKLRILDGVTFAPVFAADVTLSFNGRRRMSFT